MSESRFDEIYEQAVERLNDLQPGMAELIDPHLEYASSPIERLFVPALVSEIESKAPSLIIEVNTTIGPYAVDVLLSSVYFEPYPADAPERWVHDVTLAIELDGHEFHERSKEQARYDKERDRRLLRLGCPTIRFTGSEIWQDPFDCAREALETFWALAGWKLAKSSQKLEQAG